MKRLLIAPAALLLLTGCQTTGTAKTAWNDVIKRCANSSLNGKDILFFGPSNAVGAGSVWRIDDAGVYRLRYDLSQMPSPQNFTAPFTPTSCDGTSSKNFKVGLEASVAAAPISAEAKADFSQAKTVSAKASSVAWVPVAEGPYENYVKALPDGTPVKDDLNKGTRQVLSRAFKVSGFTTTMTFKNDVATSLKGKYPNGPLPASVVGDLSGGVTAQWSGENTLTMTSGGDFYIAGEFKPYKPEGFAATNKSALGLTVSIGKNATATRETP